MVAPAAATGRNVGSLDDVVVFVAAPEAVDDVATGSDSPGPQAVLITTTPANTATPATSAVRLLREIPDFDCAFTSSTLCSLAFPTL
ncbi:hypothetical protein [Gordonia sp. SL306]|uniref:hypothetical protein n=1 Tax=Gordonia sp. SL306 TaxID=2995145 RepID=UPI003B63C85F